ncbi:MAG TPA: DUF4783 domain-containing protein [Ferruginibacter sp.]|nr:DUF4783 domain-containing protein [Ferruginibacter sp.]HRO05858.1 DUF4783 domain-containing protein [Ferruginibacter sp.]HRO96632.1 DUF4783 domain-containing protein [Ferruginibacter sp.]HRP48842.1 DUF4783 domain-containing protein [Ferruginibacter sp.]
MKKYFASLLVFASLCSFTFATGIDDVLSALKSGNATQVAKYFDKTVDITLPGKSNNYSKSQAEVVLKDFFRINSIRAFNVIHQGENAGSQYCIGNLVTSNGTFRTTIFMKQKGEKQALQELRFETR